MATLHVQQSGWHEGELAIHSLLKVSPRYQNPTSAGLPPQLGYRVAISSLVAFGALDEHGRPWTALWGGERGFARPVAQGILGIQSIVNTRHDPIVRALIGNIASDGELVRPEDAENGVKLMSALSIDLESRDRVKLAGRMVVGTVAARPDGKGKDGEDSGVGEAQLAMLVEESLGNCPKYLNKKDIRPHVPSPELVSDALPLSAEVTTLLEKADMFFLSSTNGQTMDTNHRGGPPGFMRVMANSVGADVVLVYPEYSGNRLYQTLGNLHVNPKVGIVVPDYETSNVLYLTGETQLLVGQAAAKLMPHTKLAVKIVVQEARLVKDGLSFRGEVGKRSPYNPPVRRLAAEGARGLAGASSEATATATLVGRENLSPTVSRYTFRLSPALIGDGKPLKMWKPGQHVTLDFSEELDAGYSHMNDEDPQCLNDDFVRTFTVSNAPSCGEEHVKEGSELQITARKHGPATALLQRQDLRVPLEVSVLGFGGEESFRISASGGQDQKVPVFIAGGVGITPLLAQAPGILGDGGLKGASGLALLWSVRAEDIPFAARVLEQIQGLANRTCLFVTGAETMLSRTQQEMVKNMEKKGAKIEVRRMGELDVLGSGTTAEGREFFVCAGPEMQKVVLRWLEHEEAVTESFNY
ncbi:hypothetical protein DL764_002956 [Monosporascus ibericus]|uniref:FAD-binding FR-type domain-containing protein n=1 Tax=Monosporascus ibericus TaxID=155417 RepID=A0A4V1XBM4_9PEZI|nr:hypothetical protein DL764_002956 [Monosporascus ibericus]